MHTQRRTAAYTLQTLTLCWLCLMFLGGNSLAQTVTVSFDFDGFTEIFVSELCLPCTSVFNVAVTQGPDFVVEVTIDEDEVDSLDVTQTGTRLDFTLVQGKNQNIETLEARVTLPVLNNIDLDGVVKATLSGFNQTQLAVDVGNVSQLRGDSLMISDLTASVSGVSELDFGDISPLETASISVSGVSKATLNMNINSSLTGSVSDVSQLFYYGTNVAVSVETDIISSFIRLGDTRPGGFSERLYFAQFGNGQGFTSDTVLTNSSATETISGQVDFFDGDGLPLSMGLTSGEASSVEFEIPALGMTTIRSDGQGETMVGSAVVSSDRRVGGVVRFNISGIGIAGVSASQPLDGFITPVRRQLEGINTGVAITIPRVNR